MSEYLSFFPEPFLDDMVHGRCLPFVGAGFSLNAKVPRGKKMPDWDGLGKKVAEALPEYQYTSAVEALSAYSHEFTRVKLVEFLSSALLIGSIQPAKAHEEFCRLPFERVVTTNFDFLLEQAYALINKYCLPQISEDQLAVGAHQAGVRLLKLHGDLHHPKQLVVTEEDYDSFLVRLPLLATHLSSLLIDHTAFFIGYSLDDPDFRHMFQLVKERLGALRRPAFVLQCGAPPHNVARYERRGVKVINLPKIPLRSYGETLEIVFRELSEYWTAKVISLSTATEPEPQAELSLPSSAQSRLAFFSVPTKYAAIYKERIYPIAERYGFNPIMAADVITPGDNLMAKVYALIERSAMVVADLSSANTIFEVGMIQPKSGITKPVILITDGQVSIPFEIAKQNVIMRSKSIEEESLAFFKLVEEAFAEAFKRVSPSLEDEPNRLIEKKEYRAAVIAAFSLLEHDLRKLYLKSTSRVMLARYNLTLLLDYAHETTLLTGEEYKQLRAHAMIRNRITHSQAEVSPSQAKSIVHSVAIATTKIRDANRKR